MRRSTRYVLASLVLILSGCSSLQIGKPKKIASEDFAEGRVVDLSITEKLTGNRELLFFSLQKKTFFLEGYIQGVITDYDDNPVQGVVVRAVASGEAQIEAGEEGRPGFGSSSFDPGVSDTNGFYKIRFSLPIIDNIVDVRGRLLYNPSWEQERENLGKAYEPQAKQSQFRLYYERKRGRITFTEGIRKTIVAAVTSPRPGKIAPLPGAKQPAPAPVEKPAEKPADKAGEEMFKRFGFE